MDASEILRTAAQHVENGWCRGRLQDLNGNVCSLGALQKAADWNASPHYWAATEALAKTYAEQYSDKPPNVWLVPDPETMVWHYNDHVVSGKDAVIAAMEKAANSLEA